MTEPGYHRQPHTQDPNQEIPEDAPLAQGHSEDLAAEVKEAADEQKQQVEEERDTDEVTARTPGDHAGSDSDQTGVPDGTVEEVKDWVGDDPDRAQQALDAENARPTPRTSLVTHLEGIANG